MSKSDKDFLVSLSDTSLELVLKIFKKGEFVCPVDKGAFNGEESVGELTDLQKAVFLAREKVSEEAQALMERSQDECQFVDGERLLDLGKKYETLNELFWNLLYERFPKFVKSQNRLVIRKGWRVLQVLT
ncbi:MAG: hypothetical protein K9M44_03400 [Candidatus Pacebacteria bacterium]|nr:hypothetical protein [Candidatus Paceibacterota bacterium]